MSKQLLLIRHAKSDWVDPTLADFDRPLNERGHRNAPEMAERLIARNLIPEQIVSSPALRAITTANYFAGKFDIQAGSIIKQKEIYEAYPQDLLRIIHSFNDDFERIALFGHNPAITELTRLLTGELISNVATCGVVLINLQVDSWKAVGSATGNMVLYDYPKNSQTNV